MKDTINTIFFGSSIHSLKIINALLNTQNVSLVGLVTQPDKPTGRKQVLTPTPVSEFAALHNINIYKPESKENTPCELTDPNLLLEFIKKLNPDLIVVAYYGQKIPSPVINYPKYGALNIHPSLLPEYPGSSPAVYAILDGKQNSGVTILKMNEEFDAGEIIAQQTEKILDTDSPNDLYERLFTKGADLLVKTLPDYLEGEIKLRPQGVRTTAYAKRLSKEDGKIDWSKDPQYLERFIRAMLPWPTAWTNIEINGEQKRLKILNSHLENNNLLLDLVQLEGKKPVSFKQLKEGYQEVKISQG